MSGGLIEKAQMRIPFSLGSWYHVERISDKRNTKDGTREVPCWEALEGI